MNNARSCATCGYAQRVYPPTYGAGEEKSDWYRCSVAQYADARHTADYGCGLWRDRRFKHGSTNGD